MKRKLSITILLCLIIYYLFTNNIQIQSNILYTIKLFINNVFVFIFPMYIISKIILNYNIPYYITKYTKNNYIYIYLISLLSGSPSNIITIKDLLNTKLLTIKEANHYLKCTFTQNPLFLYSMLSSIWNIKIAIKLMLITYLTNIIIYLYKRPKVLNDITPNKELPIFDCLLKSINEFVPIFIIILGTMIIFNIIILLTPKFLSLLSGLIEITSGLNNIKYLNLNDIIKQIIALIYINFGGLSIHFQIKSILKDSPLKYSNFLYSRFLAIIISIIILTYNCIFKIHI